MARTKKDYEYHLEKIGSELAGSIVDENLEKVNEAFLNAPGILIPLGAVAQWLGITVKVLKKDKTFPCRKVSGRYLVERRALARWLS